MDIRINAGCGSGDYIGIEIQVAWENQAEAEQLKKDIPKWANMYQNIESLIKYADRKDIKMDGYTEVLRSLIAKAEYHGDHYDD